MPGISAKMIIAFAIGIAGLLGVYYDMRTRIGSAEGVSQSNNDILKEMRLDRKQQEADKKLYDRAMSDRLTAIELEQRESKIRLTMIETNLNKQ